MRVAFEFIPPSPGLPGVGMNVVTLISSNVCKEVTVRE